MARRRSDLRGASLGLAIAAVAVVGGRRTGDRPLAAPSPAEPSQPPGPTEAPPPAPFLVPVLSLWRELGLRALVLLWLAAGAWFWLWWLADERGAWSPGRGAATALLATTFVLAGYFFFLVCRLTRPNPAIPIPSLRVAAVVTKAPSEPFELVRTTLEAVLAQAATYPHAFDTWLADERPDEETLRWCLEHGVAVSTRHGVADYHRSAWPRRTRTKEGNLAWFYDTVGYDRYDVVVQLDADHQPAPGYLAAMVRPFVDERVGYVSAPSICDANEDAGWTVRGRLYREATLHGPAQAGCNDGWAPVCIGSHYAVRTAALHSVGGLGPELAEDFTTTLWLQAGGWDGVFTIDAEAHGDGPVSVAEMLQQEVQWSRSLGTVLTRWAPRKLRTVQPRAALRLGFSLVFYLVLGLQFVAATVLPVAGVLTRSSWADVTLADYYAHLWPISLVSLAVVLVLRRALLLRPVQARLWSWEVVVFQLLRWPWVGGAFVQGAWAGLRGTEERPFKVTVKGKVSGHALPARLLVPTLVLAVVPPWVALLGGDPGPAGGLLLVVALQAASYLAVAAAVVVAHVRRHGAGGPTARAVLLTWAAVPVAALAVILCASKALQG